MTNPVIYTNGYIYHNGQFIKGGFETENGIFTRIFDRDTQPESIGAKTVDLQGAYVIPGLIDIHIHGAAGNDFSYDGREGLKHAAGYLAPRGITSFVPTLMTLPEEESLKAAEKVYLQSQDGPGDGNARIVGLRMEGPFLSLMKAGAQNPEYMQTPNAALLQKIQQRSGGMLKIVDIAPEIEGALELIGKTSAEYKFSLGHTAATYEDAVKEWDIDGFKLDFIDRFALKDGVADPAVAENYAGRDIKSIPIAVDVMLSEAMRRLKAIKPDILIEFRQAYVGPSIRRFGNMLRATDCPLAMVENRNHIARIRLAAGNTAVHSDMLEWRTDDTPENAALFILNSIFGVVQYSMHLGDIGEDHLRMTAHWIRFADAHKDALLKGEFRPRHPECDFPIIESESADERVIGVYKENLVVDAGVPDKPVYILNAANSRNVVVDLRAEPAKIETYDTFGALVAALSCKAGPQKVPVPLSGYLKISWRK